MIRSKALSCGAYLPERVVTNAELSQRVGTTDEWIVERTGIHKRHIAADHQLTSDLATEAALRAVTNANIHIESIDLIIVATATPDKTFPATATKVQANLSVTHGTAFDISAVCAGFVHAVAIADSMIRNSIATTALVIGAETFSRIIDWSDRATCVLFGDGAGAILLQGTPSEGSTEERGVLAHTLHADGRLYDLLHVDGGPSSTGTVGHLRMHGREVFRHAVNNLSSAIEETLKFADIDLESIDWVIPHQANSRILDAVAKRTGIKPQRIISTVAQHANTSAASIPLALNSAIEDHRVQPGDLLLLEAIGGGMTWGSNLIRW
jgi:3-oxoacyl-[acyl-carrier-protein] synthase III